MLENFCQNTYEMTSKIIDNLKVNEKTTNYHLHKFPQIINLKHQIIANYQIFQYSIYCDFFFWGIFREMAKGTVMAFWDRKTKVSVKNVKLIFIVMQSGKGC